MYSDLKNYNYPAIITDSTQSLPTKAYESQILDGFELKQNDASTNDQASPILGSFDVHLQQNDVVCSRDKIAQTHHGNKVFRSLVQNYRETYQSAQRRKDKKAVACGIISMIRGDGGRFLRFDECLSTWFELDEAAVYEKVSHALRSAKAPKLRTKRRTESINRMQAEVSLCDIPQDEGACFQQMVSRQQEMFADMRTDAAFVSYDSNSPYLSEDDEESIHSLMNAPLLEDTTMFSQSR